jgi:phosphate starvation-inducible PhoH-like protein
MAKKKTSPTLPKPKTPNQKKFIEAIDTKPMVIALGPAGTGKSYLSAIYAGYFLKEKRVNKIVLTRPTVPTGRSIGFFPGSLNDKMQPWCRPILGTLEQYLGKGDFECQVKNENIEVVPFETIRGRSFENTFVILDEAQNATQEELKAFTTRIGNYSMGVINGDVTQTDIGTASGLNMLVNMVKNSEELSKYVPIIEFTSDDIVRSGLCQLFVEEFQDYEIRSKKRFSDDNTPHFLRVD